MVASGAGTVVGYETLGQLRGRPRVDREHALTGYLKEAEK
jgi:hypothetical protein